MCYTRNLLGKQLRSMQVAGMRNFRESWVKGSSIYIIKEKFKKEKITARLNLFSLELRS